MSTDHDGCRPHTTETVADRVARYQSTLVPDDLWERYAGDLKALVLLSQPSSAEDAKSILATASAFIADATAGDRDLSFDDLFDEVEVSAYCTRFQQRKGRTKIYDNHRGRLNRLLRAKNGIPQQQRASRADTVEPPPYTEAELASVVDAALEQGDRAAAQLVAVGAGAGRVGDDAYRLSSMPTLCSPADRLGHRPGDPVDLDAEAWKRARRHAEQVGVELTQRRLEVTWAASLVASPARPLGAVVRQHRLSRRLIENANRALPTPSDDEVVEALMRL